MTANLDLVKTVLQDNPDLFQAHPELLELVNLNDNRGAHSLLEKQIDVLKQRLADHKNQQRQFMAVARENEQISDNFSEVIYQLIGYTNLSQFATEFPRTLRHSFNIDEVSFKTQAAVERRPSDQQAYEETLRRLPNHRSACDNRLPSSIMNLFFSSDVNSAALIPLRTPSIQTTLGVLALGAKDADRYTHDLGTNHLDRLGLMAGICFARLQPDMAK